MQKITHTIILRGRYQAKIRIPKGIQKLYGGKVFYQKSLKTSDPKTAEKEVRAILAVMDAQLDQAKAEAGWLALARNLPADQRALLEGAGGLPGLLKQFERGKAALKFIDAGAPADDGVVHSDQLQIEIAEHRAASDAVKA